MARLTLKTQHIKTSFKNRLHFLFFLIFNSFFALYNAQNTVKNEGSNDSINKTDTISVKPKEQLEGVVNSKADNIRNDVRNKMTYLNQNAEVKYQDMQINADYISIDWTTGKVFARGKQNENGKIIEPAKATQAGKEYEYDQIDFNYKTRKAIAYNARTEESEGVIVAEKTKKYNDSVYFMRRGIYTTDEYYLNKKDSLADYHLKASYIKMLKNKNNSQVITGPIQMYIENVPTPLVMPFGILPITDKRSAGILIPSFGERESVGFFFNGLGYYQPIGKHMDIKVLVDLYTKGSWNLRPEIHYKKNYKYNGNFSAEVGSTIQGIKGLSDYSKYNTYKITWSHSQDTKANPLLNFSANVNVVSTQFYQNTVNNNYILNDNVLNTQQNSSVSITKRFLNLPITVTGSASYSQNFSSGLTDLRLPQINVSASQFYLFKPKTSIREGLLENITVNTSLALNNYVTMTDGGMFTAAMWDEMKTGLKNNIGIGTNTTIAKYFTFSLNATANNVLTTKTLTRSYNPISAAVENTYNKNIAGYSEFSTSASLQTILYGMMKFSDSAKIKAVRHMVTPSLSFTYRPDFGKPSWGYYKDYYTAEGALTPYSIFEGTIYGAPASGLSQSIGLNINNNLEMKVRSKTDSTGVKKIKIFENLNMSTSYNFAAEKNNLSYISFNGQSSFFENKLRVNSSLVIDPYEIRFEPDEDTGTRTNNLGKFSVQGFNVQLSYPLSNEIFGKKDDKEDLSKMYKQKGEIRNENYYFDDDNYAHFEQPWSLNINANYGYTRNLTRFGTKVASMGLTGSIKLTPYWNITGSTNYDFVSKELAYTRIGFSRDQRSFTINFNWVPFGAYKVYDFFIGIKANILSDAVKYKDRSFTESSPSF